MTADPTAADPTAAEPAAAEPTALDAQTQAARAQAATALAATALAVTALDARTQDVTARLAALDADLAVVRAARGPEQADDEHDPEGATLADDLARLTGLRRAAADELAAVEVARARMAEGSYGVCERCGGAIGEARLAVRPAATRCVRCADLR